MTDHGVALVFEGDVDALRNRLRRKPVKPSDVLPAQVEAVIKSKGEHFERYRAVLREAVGESSDVKRPAKRYGVLASKHAPKNPDRYRGEVEAGIRVALEHYRGIASRGRTAYYMLETGPGYTNPRYSVSVDSVRGLLGGLVHHAGSVAEIAESVLASGADIATLAMVHDAMADAVEAFEDVLAFTNLCTGVHHATR